MGAHTKDEAQQQHQLDHLNQDRSPSCVIIVGGGDIAISSVPVSQPGGINWRALSRAEAPPSPSKGPSEEKKQ